MSAMAEAMLAADSEAQRAARALFKAEIATVKALAEIKATSRHLQERTEELASWLTETRVRYVPPPVAGGLHLPRATPLWS
jgi:ferritin-like protein